jgi:hypothetical protein
LRKGQSGSAKRLVLSKAKALSIDSTACRVSLGTQAGGNRGAKLLFEYFYPSVFQIFYRGLTFLNWVSGKINELQYDVFQGCDIRYVIIRQTHKRFHGIRIHPLKH